MSSLRKLAVAAGLQPEWQDAADRRQTVADDALRAILECLGHPSGSEKQIAESLAAIEARNAQGVRFLSIDVGDPIRLASKLSGEAELTFEDGTTRSVTVDDGELSPISKSGYHKLEINGEVIDILVAPRRCYTIADALPGRKLWAPAVQIPSLRTDVPKAFGDFVSLADAARAFGHCGADALAISPTHALFPADASRYSPYAPSSRQFLNGLYGDPVAFGTQSDIRDFPELIDWHAAIPEKLAQLRKSFDQTLSQIEETLTTFRRQGGDGLERHAEFDALHAHFFATTGARGWQQWPTEYHDPASPTVRRFVTEHADDVTFYIFLQWLARRDLDAAQTAAKDAGMAIGLIADLAVGMDPGGSHGWSRRSDLLTGLSIGAPPDPLGPDGQSWGITGFDPQALRDTGFAPFIATIRSALAHAGGIRIDHAFGLRRLWVVPECASAAEGAYLDMPFEDLMRIVAMESQRAEAIVIGEDLGTVPDGFREAMDARAMLGMRVLWFERDADGFVPPARWSTDAVAMTGTHDLATVAGWWSGRDIDWTWNLGRKSDAADKPTDLAARAEDRVALWSAFHTGTEQPTPEDTDPVVDAAVAHVASTPCALAIIPIEDLAGQVEQPNLPGTIDEHPNWRRRMPDTTEALLARPDVAARIDTLNATRSA
ncbi:4-alpha-glucanotransferase [Sphingomonas sp. PP-F2F-G114-C0414]|uniref:4-alpha-glucanotransferase n=1 Tax=Sphingomonas sp. PP-F2F-G114-C0414 TaxID=2135662 RepID=UPI000EF921FD|nr:4-alpha-glucanotransferase [Sphingomonas sp. PP-F2F-G114-C0414]RMB26283.1 4-alpha-glucanotransferase [Sphingomonas sp. PP-F2F-G114-C0414]